MLTSQGLELHVTQFAVVLKDQVWTVFKDAEVVQTYLTRSAAIEAAENLAFAAETRGEAVDLVIQDYYGAVTEKHSGRAD